MRIVRVALITLFCLLAVPFALRVAVSAVEGVDPAKAEVPDTRALPGYEFVHHPRIAAVVTDTKAVEPDSGWDAEWVLDGVVVRSRLVGEGDLEFEWEHDATYRSHTEITDRLANLLAENGFATEAIAP